MIISKHLPMNTFFVQLPCNLVHGFQVDEEKYEGVLPEEIKSIFEGTVFHSLVYPDTTMYLDVLPGIQLSIPPVRLSDLSPKPIYDADGFYAGTRLRVPSIHKCTNEVFYHVSKGNPPDLSALKYSYSQDLCKYVSRNITHTRYSPAISAHFQSGDSFLTPGNIAVTTLLAEEFIIQFIKSLKRKLKRTSNEEVQKRIKSNIRTIRNRYNEYGASILSGMTGLICKREPATVYGALKAYTLHVVDTPGRAIYTTVEDIDGAGGDNDGDLGYIYHPNDFSGKETYLHLAYSDPYILEKEEDFTVGSTTVYNKGNEHIISLENSLWLPENEKTILIEAKSKGIIGIAWTVLQHYSYYFAHWVPKEQNPYEEFPKRLEIIRSIANSKPNSFTSQRYAHFMDSVSDVLNSFVFFTEEKWGEWAHLCYVTIADCFFPIYEAIFDMRKGDSNLPFNPNKVLSMLQGEIENDDDWNGLATHGISVEPLKEVYSSMCVDGVYTNEPFVQDNPVFNCFLTNRKNPFDSFYTLITENPDILDNFTEKVYRNLFYGSKVAANIL